MYRVRLIGNGASLLRSCVSSAAANNNHAMPATQTVSVCTPASPPALDMRSAIKHAALNSKAPSVVDESLIVRLKLRQNAATTVVNKLIQPKKPPIARVP